MRTTCSSPAEIERTTAVGVVATDFDDVCRIVMLLRGRGYRVLEFTADQCSAGDHAGRPAPLDDRWRVHLRLTGPVDRALLENRLARLPGVVQVNRSADLATNCG